MKDIPWNKIVTPEFDYTLLCSVLSVYANPRKKIHDLLATGQIVRLKKGLYCFSEKFRSPFVNKPSKWRLANLIYGPSYVSFDAALSFYQLIPERVHEIESVCMTKNKEFKTPLGSFRYRYLRREYYTSGYTLANDENGNAFLIASPEKALIDKIWMNRKSLESAHLRSYLLEDLRIVAEDLERFDLVKIRTLVSVYQHPMLRELPFVIKDIVNE